MAWYLVKAQGGYGLCVECLSRFGWSL